MAQLVEHILGKDEVISSTLISSSRIAALQKQGGFLLFCFLHLFAFFASRLSYAYSLHPESSGLLCADPYFFAHP
jgi:hypothetical protein